MSDDCRSRIEWIYFHVEGLQQAQWNSFAESVMNFFPNLKELNFEPLYKWNYGTVVSTVSNIFTHFSTGPCPHTFKLTMSADNLNRCLSRLTEREGLNAKIVIENDVYRCSKGNVEIILEVSDTFHNNG